MATKKTNEKKKRTPELPSGKKRPESTRGKPTSEKPSTKKRRDDEGRERDDFEPVPESSKYIHQFIPYILIVVMIFLVACFLLSGVEGAMGFVGKMLRDLFCGLFGWPAFLIPVILLNLIIYWRKYVDLGLVPLKVTLSFISLIFISALVHVCTLDNAYDWAAWGASIFGSGEAISNWTGGITLTGGGFIGGLIGGLFRCSVGFVGSLILLIAVIGISVMFLFSVTPRYVWLKVSALISKISAKVKENREKKRLAALEAEEEEEDEDEEEEETPTPPVTPKKPHRPAPTPEPEPEEDDESDGEDEEDEDGVVYAEPPSVAPTESTSAAPKPPRTPLRQASQTTDPRALSALVDEVFGDGESKDSETVASSPAPAPTPAPKKAPEPAPAPDSEESEESAPTTDGVILPSVAKKPVQQLSIYTFPPTTLLKMPEASREGASDSEIARKKKLLMEKLESFKVYMDRIEHTKGPTITRYELYPAPGVKANSIKNLSTDIAMVLQARIRIEIPIPGKSAIGIEVPNAESTSVAIRGLIEDDKFRRDSHKLTVCLGKDISGENVYMDIEKLTHVLIAGTTGSGKSVCINSIIISLLYKARPDEVQFIMIDPKKVEMSMYNNLPHLRVPVVTDVKKAVGTLNAAVNEMEQRYALCESVGARKLSEYNSIMMERDPEFVPIPKLVIIIDELADLMMSAPSEIETSIVRLAQKARAAGIHLIVGTQRPSVDVITGLIKANLPSRIAFAVASGIDSRTIIDTVGAEKLLGRGDMLYCPVGAQFPTRVQGTFVSDDEVAAVTDFVKKNSSSNGYDQAFLTMIEEESERVVTVTPGKKDGFVTPDTTASSGESFDELFTEALKLAVESGTIATSFLQRTINVGFGRGARILDRMAKLGFVTPQEGNKPRQVLLTSAQLSEMIARDDPRIRGIIPKDPPAEVGSDTTEGEDEE